MVVSEQVRLQPTRNIRVQTVCISHVQVVLCITLAPVQVATYIVTVSFSNSVVDM